MIMSLKMIIIVGLVAFLTLYAFTGDAFLDVILPGSKGMLGNAFCFLGGFLTNPVVNMNGTPVPIPQADDVAVAMIIATPLSYYFFRSFRWWRLLLAWAILFAVILIAYKFLGLFLLMQAEGVYGLEGCLEYIQINGEPVLPYSTYSPLFTVGIILGIIAFVGGIIKIHKWKKG